MFVPDLLHEFELGVWKGIYTHLIRILYACGDDKIQLLNSRCVLFIGIHFCWPRLILPIAIDKYLHLAEVQSAVLLRMPQQ